MQWFYTGMYNCIFYPKENSDFNLKGGAWSIKKKGGMLRGRVSKGGLDYEYYVVQLSIHV